MPHVTPWEVLEREADTAPLIRVNLGDGATDCHPTPSLPVRKDTPAAAEDVLGEGSDRDAVNPLQPSAGRSGAITIPMISLGLCVLACCLILPQIESNRFLAYERARLQQDLTHIDAQVTANGQFLERLMDDPALAERLARRQMGMIRRGMGVLELSGRSVTDMSPFSLVAVAPPPPLPEYAPTGGWMGRVAGDARLRLYAMGGALLLIVVGLICGVRETGESNRGPAN